MKKTLLLVVVFSLLGSMFAQKVDPVTARKVAVTYMQGQGMQNAEALVDVTSETPFTEFYVFAAPTGGFVLVSGDDCVVPILGYSTGNRFETEDIPEHVAEWLAGYEQEISYWRDLQNTGEWQTPDEVRLQWSLLSSGVMPPMPKNRSMNDTLTTKWHQAPYYNMFCPTNPNTSEHAYTGCSATAMGQVMKFWNWPETGYLNHSYSAVCDGVNYGWQYADFGATTYQWDSMPTQLTAQTPLTQDSAVALLLYHCGVSMDMEYSTDGSGAPAVNSGDLNKACQENALIKYFKYSPALHSVYRIDFTLSEWNDLMTAEIDAGRPVLYAGYGYAGHAFVLDGYNNDGYFHINWGWNGSSDGYYAIGGLNPGGGASNFNMDNEANIGIQPNQDWGSGGTVTVNANDSTRGTVTPSSVSYSFGNTVTMHASPNVGYRFKSWSDGSIHINRGFCGTGGDYTFTADFEPVGTDTMIMYAGGGRKILQSGLPSLGEYTWGVMYDSSYLPVGRELYKVEFYVLEAGTYDMSVYLGIENDRSLVYHTSFSFNSGSKFKWKAVEVQTPVVVDGWESMWVMFHKVGSGLPAALTAYGGIDESYIYQVNGNDYAEGANSGYSAMIRSLFRPTTSSPAPRVYADGRKQMPVGDTATFTATCTPGVTANWTFPDGNPATATGNVVSVVYNTPGTHQAFSSITHDGITVADTTSVIVVDYTEGDTISYCLDRSVVSYGGNPDNTTWGIMLPAEYLKGRHYLAEVLIYADIEGTYTLHVYQGGTDSPGTEIYTKAFVINPPVEDGYHSFAPDQIVTIDTTKNLWIVFDCDAEYPANYCNYMDEPNSDWIYADGWVQVHEASPSTSMAWLIKAVTSKTVPHVGIDEVTKDDVKVYAHDGRIVVEGAKGENVSIFDISGRLLSPSDSRLSAGVYLVKVGNYAAKKVVVTR